MDLEKQFNSKQSQTESPKAVDLAENNKGEMTKSVERWI